MADGLVRLDGVADVRVDLQQNRCTLVPAEDRTVPLHAVPDVVRGAGFRPGRMWLRAHGRPEVGADGTVRFRIDGWPRPLPLRGPAGAEAVVFGTALTARVELLPEPELWPEPWPGG